MINAEKMAWALKSDSCKQISSLPLSVSNVLMNTDVHVFILELEQFFLFSGQGFVGWVQNIRAALGASSGNGVSSPAVEGYVLV